MKCGKWTTPVYWKAEVGGREKEWYARIIDQEPDRRIAWQSEQGARNGGEVSFEPLDGSRTNISLRMEYEPEDLAESTGDVLGFVTRVSRATWNASRSSSKLAGRRRAPGGVASGPTRRRQAMPGRRQQHTVKADRMAEHIEESAKKEGRYKGREREVAWATVHKEMAKAESHRGKSSRKRKS